MKNINDMTPLAIDLPEDILRSKWCGDFKRCDRLIDIYLDNPKVPECVKERLRLEKLIIKSMPKEFVYSEDEALRMLTERIPDMTQEEFEKLLDTSAIEWIYVNGGIHCHEDFIDTLIKVHPDMAKRAGEPDAAESPARIALNENIKAMKADGESTWHIRMKAFISPKDEAVSEGEILRVHIPVPKNAMNMRNIKILSVSHENAVVGDENDPQRTVYFEAPAAKGERFEVEYEYDSFVKYTDLMKKENLELASEAAQKSAFDTKELYPHIRFTPFIRALCDELKGDESNPILIARNFYDYCTTKVTYSYMREYFTMTEIPDYCGLGLKGDCGVQALLFITLCRCAGIPARWQSGLYVNPHDVGCHDWAQFYIEPFGWLFADCSFGGSAFRAGVYERHDYYFGNLDPFRMAANSEYQAALKPEKKYLRIDPYDNQRGEIECTDRGLSRDEAESGWEITEIYKK